MDGIVLLDKPAGITSFSALFKLKKLLGIKKAGHAGTLDPFATGILPIAIGEATKILEYMQAKDKSYDFSIKFGQETDTLDCDGNVIFTTNNIPNIKDIEKVIPEFIGNQMQIPPKYSAIKINGRRAYDLARDNKDFEIQPREVSVYSIKILSFNTQNSELFLSAHVSKGTYIRSLAKDIAIKLGSLGYVNYLRRIKFGKFEINQTITLDNLEKLLHNAHAQNFLHSIEESLDDIPVLEVGEEVLKRLFYGQQVLLSQVLTPGKIAIKFSNQIRSIAYYNEGKITPLKNLNII